MVDKSYEQDFRYYLGKQELEKIRHSIRNGDKISKKDIPYVSEFMDVLMDIFIETGVDEEIKIDYDKLDAYIEAHKDTSDHE